MLETPDFDQIAQALAVTSALAGIQVSTIAEALRQMWNARGVADAKAVTLRAIVLMGTASGFVYAEHYEKTIKALDK